MSAARVAGDGAGAVVGGDRPDTADPRPAQAAEARRALRAVLGRFATGVTVVTTAYRGEPVGVTVNSFTSLSLEPPLVLWCLRRASAARTAFEEAEHFAVNILAGDQREVAARFAAPGDRFAGVELRGGACVVPLLAGTAGGLLCRRGRVVAAGDHVIVLGTVLTHWDRPGPSLIFHDGAYLTSGVVRAA